MEFDEIKRRVEKRLDDLILLSEQRGWITVRPIVLYNLSGQTAGLAGMRYGKAYIRLNVGLLQLYPDDMIHNTVGHEFAHIVTYLNYPGASAHGLEWKKVMITFGLEPTRCHSYDTSKTAVIKNRRQQKYTVYCACGPVKITATRYNKMVLKGHIYYHRVCGKVLRREPYK